MTRDAVTSDQLPASGLPFSVAVRGGGLLFLSGQVAQDPATGELVDGDIAQQADQILHNIAATLAAIGKIIYLRTNYHFDPDKISMYLRRYHDTEGSNSGVWRILKRLDPSRLPASQRYKRHDRKWKRYEKPMPGHAVQVDVKFIAPLSSASRKKYWSSPP